MTVYTKNKTNTITFCTENDASWFITDINYIKEYIEFNTIIEMLLTIL